MKRFACYAVMFTLGLVLFMGGIHNLDSGWNLRVLNTAYGLELSDSNLFFSMPPEQWINFGYLLVYAGAFMCIGSGFLIGAWVHGVVQPA